MERRSEWSLGVTVASVATLTLDTNLWSYLSLATNAAALRQLLADEGHRVVIPPLMLSEILENDDVVARNRAIALMCTPYWSKLRSEFDLQSEELTEQIRRLRPSWLRSMPKTDRLHSYRDYWTKVYWREAKADPDAVIKRKRASDARSTSEAEFARVQAANKKDWPFVDGDMVSSGMSAVFGEEHPDPDPGSRLGWPAETAVPWWKVSGRDVWWHQISAVTGVGMLKRGDTTISDFLGAYVDLNAMRRDRASFNQFFLFEVESWDVPRLWWQGTVELMQLGTKLTHGNAGDVAHASHMPDCDYFLTADRRFAAILTAASTLAGSPRGGAPVLVEPHQNGWLAALRDSLASLPPLRNPPKERVVLSDTSLRIGTGPGEFSPGEVRKIIAAGPTLTVAVGSARLATRADDEIAPLVWADLTNDETTRPAGIPNGYYGTITLPDESDVDLQAYIASELHLHWIDARVKSPTRIWMKAWDAELHTAAVAVNGKLKPIDR